MKYIISTFGFIIFLLVITSYTSFTFNQDVDTYDLSENPITTIDVKVDNINVTVTSTLDKDIRIEHVHSNVNNPTSNLYSYRKQNQLIIREYPYNKENVVPKKETLNIYIPSDYQFEELKIASENGMVSIDDCTFDKISLTSEYGNIDIANVKSQNFKIDGNTFGINANNVSTDKFYVEMNQTSINMENIIADQVGIDIKNESKLVSERVIANYVAINGAKLNAELTLSDSLNYIINTQQNIANNKFEKTESGYKYTANDKSSEAITYNIESVQNLDVNLSRYEESENVENAK